MKILLLVVLSYPARVLGYSARRVRNDPSLIDALLILGIGTIQRRPIAAICGAPRPRSRNLATRAESIHLRRETPWRCVY